MQFDVTDSFRVTGDIKYAYNENYQQLGQGYYGLLKVFSNVPYLSDVTGTNLPYDGQGNYGAFTNSELLAVSSNVIAGARRPDNDNGRNVVLGNFSAEYDFLDGFTGTVNFGFNSQNYAGWGFNPSYFLTSGDNNPNASYNISQNTSNEVLMEALLEYNKEFGKHNLNILAVVSSQKNKFKNVYVNSEGFLNNDIRDLSQAERIIDSRGTFGTSTLASQFARLNYNFDSKYYFTGTVRRDGNGDRFGPNNLYAIFSSVAASWNIDQESFMQESIFDQLKLRASWGETGNYFGIPSFQYRGFYNSGTSQNDANYVLGGQVVQGLQPFSLPNPDLKWETQRQTDIGIDGELLDSRLYFTADWFRKESSDFLFQQLIPAQTGFSFRSVNGGNVVNSGVELLVGYRKTTGDFTWDVSANFTKVHNEIKELIGGIPYVRFDTEFAPGFVDNWQGITRSYEGGNVGTFYGYRAEGIFQNQSEIDALNSNAPEGVYQDPQTAPGDRKFRDLDGDGKVTGEDRQIIGSPIPDFFGGLNLNGSYKNFDLGIDIYGTYGNDILNFTRVEQETAGGYGLDNAYSNVSTNYFNNRWTETNPSNTYARAVVADVNKNNRVSDHYVEDGSYLRLRNVKLGYNIPPATIERLGLSNLKFYVSAQNLITLTSYSGWDPEIGQVSDFNGNSGVQSRGIDFASYPITPIYTMGVNLQF
jgi:TonB-linked SusC/RagA family outer membrane protein